MFLARVFLARVFLAPRDPSRSGVLLDHLNYCSVMDATQVDPVCKAARTGTVHLCKGEVSYG